MATAEERRQIVEGAIAWCEAEVKAMKAAEANMNWRYTKWRMDFEAQKPRLKKEFTDKRTGAVAWEAFDHELMALRCQAYCRFKIFKVAKYGFGKDLDAVLWQALITHLIDSNDG